MGERMVQLDLFGDRTMSFAKARTAMLDFDLDAAEGAFIRHLQQYPADTEAASHLACVARWQERVRAAQAKNEFESLSALKEDLPEELMPRWHLRLGQVGEREAGPGAYVLGAPAGLHFLLGHELCLAESSLRSTLEAQPSDARARGYLAEVLEQRGETPAARREWLRAFVDGPGQVDLGRISDEMIVDLLQRVPSDYTTQGPATEWVAAAGLIEGLFAWPPAELPDLSALHEGPTASAEVERCPGLRFYDLLLSERRNRNLNDRVGLRRRMKQLCPELLDAYLNHR